MSLLAPADTRRFKATCERVALAVHAVRNENTPLPDQAVNARPLSQMRLAPWLHGAEWSSRQ